MGQVALEVLRGLPFVEDMEPRHIDILAAMAKEVGFEQDQIIFREGDTNKQFYIVLSGQVALEITTHSGVVRVLTVYDGSELGWSFMLSKTGRHFRARALDRVRALLFQGDALQKACEEDAVFGNRLTRRVLRVVSDRLAATRKRLADLHGA